MMRAHRQVDGSLALKLDFGGAGTFQRRRRAEARPIAASGGGPLKLAAGDKYNAFEHRRRQAQIRARHLLDLMGEN